MSNRLVLWVQKSCKQMVIYPQNNHVANRPAARSTAQHPESFYPVSLAREKIKVWFLLNAYCFCTIVKLKKSNPCNSGTLCIPEGKRIIERLRLAFRYLVECDMQGAESSGLLPPHVNLTCLPLCLLFPPMVSLLWVNILTLSKSLLHADVLWGL